jgi:hypothetical protein
LLRPMHGGRSKQRPYYQFDYPSIAHPVSTIVVQLPEYRNLTGRSPQAYNQCNRLHCADTRTGQ